MADSSLEHQNALLIGQQHIRELVATGAPLGETLADLARFIEGQEEGLRCAVRIVSDDRLHLRRGSGPNLPEAYHRTRRRADRPALFRPREEAAHRGTTVAAPYIAKDSRWAEAWRELAVSCGLAACRSTPVVAADGTVLAAFAMYYDRPRDPDPDPAQPRLIEIATHLASIRDRARASAEGASRERGALPRLVRLGPGGGVRVRPSRSDRNRHNRRAAELWLEPVPGDPREINCSMTPRLPTGEVLPHMHSPIVEAAHRDPAPGRGGRHRTARRLPGCSPGQFCRPQKCPRGTHRSDHLVHRHHRAKAGRRSVAREPGISDGGNGRLGNGHVPLEPPYRRAGGI